MQTRLIYVLVGALAGAAIYAAVSKPSSPSGAASATVTSETTAAPEPADPALPPGHPAIDDGNNPHGQALPPNHPPIGANAANAPNAANADDEPPSAPIEWKAPSSWKKAPNPSAMRIATYRCAAAAPGQEEPEVSVVAAGGSPEANIARWVGQFDPQGRREERPDPQTIAGLKVRVVHVRGTYLAGSMGGEPAKKTGFALLGAVVESPDGGLTFFKMTGPDAAVEKERGAFDQLVKSVVPVKPRRTL